LSDLRESGAIEQDADIVMFINRPEATATAEELASGKIVKGAAELIIAKHRNGSQGRIQLKFIGESTKFVDEDAQNREDEPPEYSHASQSHELENFEGEEPAEEAFPPVTDNNSGKSAQKEQNGQNGQDEDEERPFD
jgi:replicative DNA helicase